jgi:hypothetical protein
MTVSRFVLVDFRYTSDSLGHIRLYEAGNTYDMPPAMAHAAAKRDLVAAQRPVDWERPSILRQPEVLTEAELAAGADRCLCSDVGGVHGNPRPVINTAVTVRPMMYGGDR